MSLSPPLFGFCFGLPRPSAGQALEAHPGAAVDQPAHDPEDRPLHQHRQDHFPPRDIAVLGIRRLLVIDQTPKLLEELFADQPPDETGEDADGGEEDLAHERRPESRPNRNPATKAAPAATGSGFSFALFAAWPANWPAESGEVSLALPTTSSFFSARRCLVSSTLALA